jgi:hypothetical protein
MTDNTILYLLVGAVFALEIFSFFVFYGMISKGVVSRKKEYARLDSEREQLLHLQNAVGNDLRSAKQLSTETLSKLNKMASQLDANWQESTQKIEILFQELTQASHARVTDDLARIQKSRLSVEKSLQMGNECSEQMAKLLSDSRRLLKALDGSIPTEEILREIQSEKYSQARELLQGGFDATAVARKLGLSLSEVNLLSFSK